MTNKSIKNKMRLILEELLDRELRIQREKKVKEKILIKIFNREKSISPNNMKLFIKTLIRPDSDKLITEKLKTMIARIEGYTEEKKSHSCESYEDKDIRQLDTKKTIER
ncbi:MAG: hypothetical protein JJV93_01310 [Alphaproteobacteria bacterium]|nr:hypothetical protein [Alphaproteobacteria bacterium]MBL0717888.1 hypothetical protein [Alphaproteobacteria bacterium]